MTSITCTQPCEPAGVRERSITSVTFRSAGVKTQSVISAGQILYQLSWVLPPPARLVAPIQRPRRESVFATTRHHCIEFKRSDVCKNLAGSINMPSLFTRHAEWIRARRAQGSYLRPDPSALPHRGPAVMTRVRD